MTESASKLKERYVAQLNSAQQQLTENKRQSNVLTTQIEQLKGAVFALDSLAALENDPVAVDKTEETFADVPPETADVTKTEAKEGVNG